MSQAGLNVDPAGELGRSVVRERIVRSRRWPVNAALVLLSCAARPGTSYHRHISVPKITPMRLLLVPEPLANPHLTWEIKLDGFRALAFIENGRCTFVSRNGHTFKSWPSLCGQLLKAVRCRDAIVDGEIVCLGADGRANFRNLLFRRQPPHFVPFDLLGCDGQDLTQLPLVERKARLRRMVRGSGPVMLLDGIRGRGQDLFREVCRRDIEGIVGKYVGGSYCTDGRSTSWVKVKNPTYSQMEGRAELFERRGPRACSAGALPLDLG